MTPRRLSRCAVALLSVALLALSASALPFRNAFHRITDRKAHGSWRRDAAAAADKRWKSRGQRSVLQAAQFKPTVVVAKDGSGNFKSIQAAINALPPTLKTRRRFLVYVKAGTYDELVTIPADKPFITMVGDAGRTIVRMDRTAGKANSTGVAQGTENTATMTVRADDFTLLNMAVLNTAPRPPPSVLGGQAVAFMSSGNRTLVNNCTFRSFQDTLYASKGMQYYKNCFIAGSIDFVFGNARAVFDGCTFYMDSMGFAGVTAHHKIDQYDHTCFVILRSNFTGRNQGWLGRSWGKYACTIVAYSQLGSVVAPDGWNNFGLQARDLTSFFAEHGNTGVGADLSGRVWWEKVLTPAQRSYYLTPEYVGLSQWVKPLVTAPPNYSGKPSFAAAVMPAAGESPAGAAAATAAGKQTGAAAVQTSHDIVMLADGGVGGWISQPQAASTQPKQAGKTGSATTTGSSRNSNSGLRSGNSRNTAGNNNGGGGRDHSSHGRNRSRRHHSHSGRSASHRHRRNGHRRH